MVHQLHKGIDIKKYFFRSKVSSTLLARSLMFPSAAKKRSSGVRDGASDQAGSLSWQPPVQEADEFTLCSAEEVSSWQ